MKFTISSDDYDKNGHLPFRLYHCLIIPEEFLGSKVSMLYSITNMQDEEIFQYLKWVKTGKELFTAVPYLPGTRVIKPIPKGTKLKIQEIRW